MAIGDSLSLPGHLNKYEDTWAYRLKVEFNDWDFITCFRRSLTTDALVTLGGGDSIDNKPFGADCLEFYMPNIVILQLGIVDCAPRYINHQSLEKKILSRLPKPFRNAYISFVKKTRTRTVARAKVPPNKFRTNLDNYLERCKAIDIGLVVIISICLPDVRMIEKNTDIARAVIMYNTIYEGLSKKYDFVRTIDPLNSLAYKFEIFEDGYHPTPLGNEIVYHKLSNVLRDFNLTRENSCQE